MSKFTNPLYNIKIASPCSADWTEMMGDERKRYCGDCKLNVYNLSEMTKTQAEDLIIKSEGNLCVRFYRRADGTILTQDCPVGWQKIKQHTRVFAATAFSLIVSLFSGLLFVSIFTKPKELLKKFPTVFLIPTPEMRHTTGVMALPSPTPKKKPTTKATPENDKSDVTIGRPMIIGGISPGKD
ncbi:MAG: hypothetical protein M3Q99_06510 [Acidobacteriota bacterium]|nr:hypothetical protein [Acidobacteriota bacterium]